MGEEIGLKEISVIRGLCIFFLISSLCYSPITHFADLFNISVLIISIGFCFNSEDVKHFRNLLKYVWNRIISLWIPYFIVSICFILLKNIIVGPGLFLHKCKSIVVQWPLSLSESLKMLLFTHNSQLLSGSWLIKILFIISILYAIVSFFTKICFQKVQRENYENSESIERILFHVVQICISIVFFVIGYTCSLQGIQLIGRAELIFSYYALFEVGYILKSLKVKNLDRVCVISPIILVISSMIATISIADYTNMHPLFLLINAIAGWFICYGLAKFIVKTNCLNQLFTMLSKNVVWIIMIIFMLFRIVNILEVIIMRESYSASTTFSVLYACSGWWILYIIVGLFGSILLSVIVGNIRDCL